MPVNNKKVHFIDFSLECQTFLIRIEILLALSHANLSSIGTVLTPCQQEFMEGRFKPLCTPNGEYENIQCQGTACFCVNERGDEIATSRTELPTKPNCTSAGI